MAKKYKAFGAYDHDNSDEWGDTDWKYNLPLPKCKHM